MLSDIKLNGWLDTFWQFNLDLTVIVMTVLLVRFFIRKTTKSYNSYLLWLAIPLGFVVAKVIALLDFSTASSSYIGQAVAVMIAKPVETLQNYWWLGALWLSGTTLLLLRLVIQHIELRRDLTSIRRPNSELPGHNLFTSRHYQIIAVEHKEMSPAVYGFIKPKIYFPLHVAKELNVQQIQLIIEHEEQHIKQKHLWLNLLWDVLVCIGWFNPLIYIARKNFRHDQELFCDYLVLNKSSKSRTKDYGHALLSTVSATHSVSLLCSWKVFNQLEERIMNITKPINRKGKAALTLGAGLVLSCCAVYAANKEVHEKSIVTNTDTILELKDDDGVTYIQENDNYYIEENGKRREMTDAERAEFERKHQKAMEQLKLTEEELIHVEKEIEQAHKELELHEEEIELAAEEMERAHDELARAQEEVELEFERGRLSKEEMKRVKESLERAKAEMKRDRKHIKIDMQRAKRDLERAKIEIRKKIKAAPGSANRVIVIDGQEIVGAEPHSKHVVKWVGDDGKVFVKEDGEYSIKVDGEKRVMTDAEKAQFDKKIMFIPEPATPVKPPKPAKPAKPADGAALAPVHQPAPTYPESAMKQGIEGYVNVAFDINGKGKATNITVKNASANGIFNQEAINNIKQWTFASQDFGKKDQMYQIKFALD